jgi:pyridoxine 5-phosphate synthase
MAPTEEMTQFAISVLPDMVTLVPESRQELTTEGGLNVSGQFDNISKVVTALKNHDITVSIFIEADQRQIKDSKKIGADFVELHTGKYANAFEMAEQGEYEGELRLLKDAAQIAHKLGLGVNAGHGLNYQNVQEIAKIPGMRELNIGHSIIGRSVLVGIERAVREMKQLIKEA